MKQECEKPQGGGLDRLRADEIVKYTVRAM